MRGILVLLMLVELGQAADVAVGTAKAPAGQKATGFIQVPAGADAATNIPVIVVNGAKPGPKLALIAGSHGTEYASIIALEKMAQSADPAGLSGTLIIVPLINLASFAEKVPHLNPVDGKSMNRLYPGKADGTQTERALWAIGKQVVEKCDYLIDLHGGDLDENLRQYSYWPKTGKEQLDAASRGMVLAFGLDHIIVQDSQGPAPATMSIGRFSVEKAKPTVVAEAGHAGTTNAGDVEALVRGCTNVMRYLKMLPGSVAPVEHPLWIGHITVVASENDGVFYPVVTPEAYVQQGMTLGYVTDFFGEKLADVKSPVAGVIIYVCSVPSMKKGNPVAYVGEIQ
jgi:predicted deacylase